MVTRCYALYRKGLYHQAIRWGRLGISLARRGHDPGNLAYAYNAVASSYLETGDVRKAIRYRLLALRIYRQINDLAGQAHANNNLGVCYQSTDQTKALESYRSALAYYERVGNVANTAICHNNVGEVLFTMGMTDQALDEFEKALAPYAHNENPPYIYGLVLVNMSRAYQRKHDYGKAFDSILTGIRHLKKIGAKGLTIEGTLQQAEIELDSGDLTGALRTVQGSLKEASSISSALLQSRGLRISGRIRSEMHEYEQAEADLEESLNLARRARARYEEGLSLLRLAEIRRRQGKDTLKEYRTLIRNATSILDSIGATGDLAGIPDLG